jgi:hypothetical protein
MEGFLWTGLDENDPEVDEFRPSEYFLHHFAVQVHHDVLGFGIWFSLSYELFSDF